jgi:DNA-directed RNA polymerase specialized sigma24 family protein
MRLRLKANLNHLFEAFQSDPAQEQAFWAALLKHITKIAADEDIASTALLHIIEALPRYRHQGLIDRWISRIVKNAGINGALKKSEDALDEDDIETANSKIPMTVPMMLDLDVIQDPIDRMLCELVMDQKTVKEAASTCGMSYSAARRRLKALKNKLGDRRSLLLF